MSDYYKEFIGRGDEADRDRRTRRNKRTDQIRKNQFKRAINLGKGAVKKVGPLGFISTLLSPTPAYKKGGKVK